MEQRIVLRQSHYVSLSMVINWGHKYFEFHVDTLNEGFTYDEDEFRFAVNKYEELEKESLNKKSS